MNETIQKLIQIIEDQQKTNEVLTAKIKEMKSLLFEKSSEKSSTKTKRIPKPTSKQKVSQDKVQKARKEKREQQKSLPAESIKIPVEESRCSCDCCEPKQFKIIGSKVLERIEYIPSVLKRYQYHLQTKKCICGKMVVSAQSPENVVEGGKYGPGFHAHVMVSKVDDSLPLERQAKILGRSGVEINKSTLCDVFHRSAQLLFPIYEHFISRLQESELVNADETTIKLQKPKQCKTAYMWTFLDSDQIVYSFSEGRSGNKVVEILSESKGLLQSDGYSGYNKGHR